MEAFEPIPPEWTLKAIHARGFCCPSCRATAMESARAWINRRAPVYTEEHRRKWQEFYECTCGSVWWGWSSERPPSELTTEDRVQNEDF